MTLEMAPCKTPVIFDIYTWKKKQDPRTEQYFNNYGRDIGWHDDHFGLRWQFAYSDGSQLKLVHTMCRTAFEAIGVISTPEREGHPGQSKFDGRP